MDQLKDYFVILLSAGSGERMGSIGKSKPKSLLKIGNETILYRIFQTLKSKGAKEINLILGFKYKKILEEMKKFKDIKFNYLVIKDFVNNGSVYSLFKSKDLWRRTKKKSILMMHTDLIFNEKYIDNIISDKRLNVIGVQKKNKIQLKKNSFVAQVNKDMRIKKIGKYSEIKNPYGEILCINKFSKPMFNQLIIFLRNYFKKKNTKITWEYPVSEFAQKNKLYNLKDQNYYWININKPKDITLAKKIFN